MSVQARPAIDLVDYASFDGGQLHDQFRWIRENEPVFKHPRAPRFPASRDYYWALMRYTDVRNVGRDDRSYSNHAGGIHSGEMLPEGLEMVRNMRRYMEPPEHHRCRRLVRDPFQPDGAEAMRARVEALTTQIVDQVAARGECDLVTDIAGELPSYV